MVVVEKPFSFFASTQRFGHLHHNGHTLLSAHIITATLFQAQRKHSPTASKANSAGKTQEAGLRVSTSEPASSACTCVHLDTLWCRGSPPDLYTNQASNGDILFVREIYQAHCIIEFLANEADRQNLTPTHPTFEIIESTNQRHEILASGHPVTKIPSRPI